MKVSQVVEAYTTSIETYLAPTSLKAYRHKLNWLNQKLGNMNIETVDRNQLERVVADYRETHAPATTRLFIVAVKGAWSWAFEEGHITKNPAARLRKPRAPRRNPRSFPDSTVVEILTILDTMRPTHWHERRNRALLIVALHTGLRRAELCGLRWCDVDLVQARLTVVGKGDRERVVPLNATARRALRTIQRSNHEYVFCRAGGAALNPHALDTLIKRWCGKHEIPYAGLHVLRHTFATRLLARGVSLTDIRDLMGHESVRTTEVYLQGDAERLRGAVERL
jgi:integrase/recombinase XerC